MGGSYYIMNKQAKRLCGVKCQVTKGYINLSFYMFHHGNTKKEFIDLCVCVGSKILTFD